MSEHASKAAKPPEYRPEHFPAFMLDDVSEHIAALMPDQVSEQCVNAHVRPQLAGTGGGRSKSNKLVFPSRFLQLQQATKFVF